MSGKAWRDPWLLVILVILVAAATAVLTTGPPDPCRGVQFVDPPQPGDRCYGKWQA